MEKVGKRQSMTLRLTVESLQKIRTLVRQGATRSLQDFVQESIDWRIEHIERAERRSIRRYRGRIPAGRPGKDRV